MQFTKSSELPIATLMQVLPKALEARVLFFPVLPRNVDMLQAGVLDAPIGDVTICFVNVRRMPVGVACGQTGRV